MGKRKRSSKNIVKLDYLDVVGTEETLPVLVQELTKDGRRMKQTIHTIPTPQNDPPPPTFDPSPAFEAAEGHTFFEECDPKGEPSGTERVCLRFFFPRCILTRYLS